jgi:hypothetical protein
MTDPAAKEQAIESGRGVRKSCAPLLDHQLFAGL